MSVDRYSAHKFVEFWGYVIAKGLMNRETATSRKIAAQKVLAIASEEERQDLRSLDRDGVFVRFENLEGKKYSPQSLRVYRSRFNTALDDFIKWSENPSGSFKSPPRVKPSTDKKSGKPKKPDSQPRALPSVAENVLGTENLTLPIPIRAGVVVKIFGLPVDLATEEAEKIAGVIKAYAVKGSA